MTYLEAYQQCENLESLCEMVKDDFKTALWLNPDRVSKIEKALDQVLIEKYSDISLEQANKLINKSV